jgi:hypothetical protein
VSGDARSLVVGAKGGVCPFPGFKSYNLLRTDTFKGRDEQVVELARMIMGNRLTVIDGASGEGKSSLLHAGLAPLLLREGIVLAMAEPGGTDPIGEIVESILPRVNLLGRDLTHLAQWLVKFNGDTPDSPLGEVRAVLRDVLQMVEDFSGPSSSNSRPVEIFKGGPLWTWLAVPGSPDSLVTDCLSEGEAAGPVSDWTVADILRLAERQPAPDEWRSPPANADALRDAQAIAHERLRDAIGERIETDPGFSLVLIVDQFEEVFVQYGKTHGAEGAAARRYLVRDAFLEFIQALYEDPRIPLRLVLSLRKEHYADLPRSMPRLPSLSDNSFHLFQLSTDDARQALAQLIPIDPTSREPVDLKEWPDLLDDIVGSIEEQQEPNKIDATILSSVGRFLWERPVPDTHESRTIVERAVDAQVRPALEIAQGSAIASVACLREAFEMLDMLYVREADGSGRRRPVDIENMLTVGWQRSETLRPRIRHHLERFRLIRTKRQSGGLYIDIAHERLIDVLTNLRQEWSDRLGDPREFSAALDRFRETLRDHPFGDSGDQSSALSPRAIEVLHDNSDRLQLSDYAAASLMTALLMNWPAEEVLRDQLIEIYAWLRAASRKATALQPDVTKYLSDDALSAEHVPITWLDPLTTALRDSVLRTGQRQQIVEWLVASAPAIHTVASERLIDWGKAAHEIADTIASSNAGGSRP